MQEISPELKITCMSDTHGNVELLDPNLEGDIFIHAGDFTQYSKEEDFFGFLTYLSKLKFRYKVVICGNNERAFDEAHAKNIKRAQEYKKRLSQHCIYLEDSCAEIEGIRVFGSPATIKYGALGFSYDREDGRAVWENIPDVDILITHQPPFMILDVGKSDHVGCEYLLERVKKMKPRLHIFGHIHESYGVLQTNTTTYINAAQCGSKRILKNTPVSVMYDHINKKVRII